MTTPIIYKRTKILATVGPATYSYKKIYELALSGVNGFRLNFSHGTNDERDQQIAWIRQASKELGKPVAILQDLQGPKIRLGEFEGKVDVKQDEEWTLVYGSPSRPDDKVLAVQYDLSQKMKVGECLFIFDGKIRTTVTHIEDKAIRIHIENDGFVMQKKGLNLPDTDFGGDILTEKDLRDIEFGATRDFDYVALSFVQSTDDITNLRQILVSQGSTAQIIAKIETKAAITGKVLDEITQVSDGVMVARGDLAVEVSLEAVPIVQRDIIALCQKYGKLSIVATQMMASMVDSPVPTRAEVSDIANAVIIGADCLMLSDETANGSYPIETIAAMKRVILYTQDHVPVRAVYYRDEVTEKQDAISSAAVTLAHQIDAAAIIAETKTGTTAESMATHRPGMPIISVTSDPRVAQQLALMYANRSYCRPDGEHAGLGLARELRASNYFAPNTTVILVSGRHPGLTGATDTIRVRVLE